MAIIILLYANLLQQLFTVQKECKRNCLNFYFCFPIPYSNALVILISIISDIIVFGFNKNTLKNFS